MQGSHYFDVFLLTKVGAKMAAWGGLNMKIPGEEEEVKETKLWVIKDT